MVNNEEQQARCGSCREVIGNVWQGFVFCQWLRCDVYADSLQCDHGRDLEESW